MLRDGIRGIEDIPDTGQIFIISILIGVDTDRVRFITGDFMRSTIVARAAGGIKDSVVVHLIESSRIDDAQVLDPMSGALVIPVDPLINLKELAMVLVNLENPVMVRVNLQNPVMALVNLEKLVMVLANLQNLAMVRKDIAISHVRWAARPWHIW
jgi:hypothetical protein